MKHESSRSWWRSPTFDDPAADDSDGSQGAARGAAMGFGFYSNFSEAFQNLNKTMTIEPNAKLAQTYADAYGNWRSHLLTLTDKL